MGRQDGLMVNKTTMFRPCVVCYTPYSLGWIFLQCLLSKKKCFGDFNGRFMASIQGDDATTILRMNWFCFSVVVDTDENKDCS